MSKRLLIIGYAFVEGNMGGVRLRRVARLLPRHGWEPIVLTHPRDALNSYGPETGARFEEIAAPNLAQFYQRIRRFGRKPAPAEAPGNPGPKALDVGFTSTVNRWLMVPDKQIPWYRAAVRRGRELLATQKVDAIFASQDPRTTLLVAARLSGETGVPCVLEYRDLWTGTPYYHLTQPTWLHRKIHERLERRALREATRVSAVCRGIAGYLSAKYAALLRAPVELNYNFFDPEEYAATAISVPAERPFTISYAGALYASRGPHQFLEGLRIFLDRATLTPAQFRFCWAGVIAGIRDLDEILDRTALRPYIDFLGQVAHREALRRLQQSHASLLIQAPDDAIHIPGKLFEALGARVPLLALANPCEAAEIIDRCRAGIVCPHEPNAVANALTQLHKFSLSKAPWTFNESEVDKFSAYTAVGKLADLFCK